VGNWNSESSARELAVAKPNAREGSQEEAERKGAREQQMWGEAAERPYARRLHCVVGWFVFFFSP